MAFGVARRRADLARREFELDVRTLLAQWEIDSAASWERRRILRLAQAKQLEQQLKGLRLEWRKPFE